MYGFQYKVKLNCPYGGTRYVRVSKVNYFLKRDMWRDLQRDV